MRYIAKGIDEKGAVVEAEFSASSTDDFRALAEQAMKQKHGASKIRVRCWSPARELGSPRLISGGGS